MKYIIYKNIRQKTFAVFTLGDVNEQYFVKISNSKQSKYIVIVQRKKFEQVLSTEMHELVDDFDNKTFNTYNSEQKIPKAIRGFSYGIENAVPFAYIHLHEDQMNPSFTDGRTRTAFLIHKKIPSFPVLTDEADAKKMMKSGLIDDSFGIVKVEELFEPKSETYKVWCQGFQEQDYLPSNPKAKEIYLKHKKELQQSALVL